MTPASQSQSIESSYLWFLTLSYIFIIMLANWFDPRLVKLFDLVFDAGTLVFPFTFLLSDLITEVYGYKHARRAIWCGFLFNFVFIGFSQLVIHLPSPDFAQQNQAFDALLLLNTRMILASFVSYLCSEPFNSYVMAKLKLKMRGRMIGVRFVLSTLLAAGIDSILFGILAFYGILANQHLSNFIFTMWALKVLIEVTGLPLAIFLAKKLKTLEQIDIYDYQTQFNLFTLDTTYKKSNNHFATQERT